MLLPRRFTYTQGTITSANKILSQSELAVLTEADAIYGRKGFEYFVPTDALTGFSQYPDLGMLDAKAKKLIDSGSTMGNDPSLTLYSPECVEEQFSEARGSKLPRIAPLR
jgi:hypothetical protein